MRAGDQLCHACRRDLRHLGPDPVRVMGLEVWAPVGYEGPARDLVRALKFRGALGAADTMAALMAAGAPPDLLPRPGPAELQPPGPARLRSPLSARCSSPCPSTRPAGGGAGTTRRPCSPGP